MTDEDYLAAVLNCDDQSGMATDAAWRAVSALRDRAERAEAAIQVVRWMCQSAIDESYLTDASIARAAMANRIIHTLDGAS